MISIAHLHVAALASLALGASTGAADVTLVSRQSEVISYETYYDPFAGFVYRYDERESFTGAGSWSVDLPHAPAHTEFVSSSLISGSFESGTATRPAVMTSSRYSTAMTVRFRVDGAPASVSLDYAGYVNASQLVTRTGNIVLQLVNLDTGIALFDIYDRPFDAWAVGSGRWDPAVWSADLATGNYELRAHAIVINEDFRGSGLYEGYGELTMSMSIVPAPATLALLPLGLIARRRHR